MRVNCFAFSYLWETRCVGNLSRKKTIRANFHWMICRINVFNSFSTVRTWYSNIDKIAYKQISVTFDDFDIQITISNPSGESRTTSPRLILDFDKCSKMMYCCHCCFYLHLNFMIAFKAYLILCCYKWNAKKTFTAIIYTFFYTYY